MSFLRRKAAVHSESQKVASADHEAWLLRHPALGEYMSAPTYPDGGQRQTATVLLFVEGGEVKACLRDRDTDMSLWASARSIPGVLEALEAILQTEEPGWRKNQQWNPQGKKRK